MGLLLKMTEIDKKGQYFQDEAQQYNEKLFN